MNKKLLVVGIMAVLMLSTVFVGTASAVFPLLPTTAVTLDITNETPLDFPFDVLLSNFPPGTFDVAEGTYTGWCIDLDTQIDRSQTYQAMLYSSLTPPMGFLWDQAKLNMINSILNNKQGTDQDVQVAIWLALGYSESKITSETGFAITGDAQAMAAAADAGFSPGPGDVLGIICEPIEPTGQLMIIEIQIPGEGEGLTPGFWKNNAVNWAASWWAEPYTPGMTLAAAGFTGASEVNLDDTTMLEALDFGGGKGIGGAEQILLRAAVAALLNAASPEVDYPLSVAQVLGQVNSALASGNRDTILSAASTLDAYNNLGADLPMSG